ncbi:MAG: hypothetical protein LBT93_02085 [Treponema sp.]|jgi:hypothetical protein|nr:hypothetical protein [Treponema sp.]
MKKIFVAFLILAVAGGWLVAQDDPTFTWSGEFVTGAHVVVNEAIDDPLFTLANDDGRNRVRVNGALVGPTYGLNFRLQAANIALDPPATTDGTANTTSRLVTLPFAYGYVTFLDNLLKVTAGQIDPAVWGTGGTLDASWDAGAAVRFEFTPAAVEGLNVGFSLKFSDLERPHSLAAGVPIADVLQETVLGFKYTGLSILDIKGSFKLDGDADAAKDMNAGLGIALKGTPLTTAALEFVGVNLSDLEDTGTGEIRLGQKVVYDINALTLQLSAREYIYTLKDKDLGLWIEPVVKYKINDSLTAALNAVIGSGDMFENIGFEIKPSLTYTVGKATIDFIYRFNSHSGRPDLWTVAAEGSSLQAIGANFKWAF